MGRKMPPLTWFRAFEASARCLSFTGAADELGLTQSAVSQHVRSLELRFGVVLFHRKSRGLALSDDGRRLLPDVSKALGSLAAVSQAFDAGSQRNMLTVATSVSFSQWYIAPGLREFWEAHPDIRLRIVNTTWPDEFHMPLADVEVRFGSEALVGKGAQRLLPDQSVVVASPSLAVDPNAFGEQSLIEAVGTSDGWKNWMQQVDYPDVLEPDVFVDSHGLAVDLARRGVGVALTSSLLAKPCLDDGSLVLIPAGSAPSVDGYFLAVKRDQNPLAQIFEEWLLARVSGHLV